MATRLTLNPTLLDIQRAIDPDGTPAMVAEMMHTVNPILDDMPMMEGNLQTGHQGTIRTGLPTPAWRLLNYPTTKSKSKRAQVIDTCGNLEAWAEVDEELFKLNGAKEAFRMSEDVAHIEAMAQEIATTLFYGNTAVNPERFLGLSPRFNLTTAENGSQVILGGGASTDNTSMWLLSWGPRSLTGIYPKGMNGGLDVQNLGVETSETSNGLMRVLRTKFNQKLGIHLTDWEGCVRICNLDVSSMATGDVDLISLMIEAWYTIPLRLRNQGRLVFYCNPTVKQALVKRAIQVLEPNHAGTGNYITGGHTLTVTQLENSEPMLRFWGIPVKECDAIVNTEDLVA